MNKPTQANAAEILKTVGVTSQDGPTAYEITTTEGNTFLVEKEMHKWICKGRAYNSIREVKDNIKAGQITNSQEADTEATTAESTPLGTWFSCCPACLFLVNRANDLEPLSKLERVLLGCYGLMLESGEPNYEYAEAEVARVEKALDKIEVDKAGNITIL